MGAPAIYMPLGPNEFRVLELRPADGDLVGTPIRASLICVAFDSAPSYESVSYAWGDRSAKHRTLTIGSFEVCIGTNLFECLSHLRPRTGLRRLWVDALCINQADDDEKSIQVQRMGQIYHSASRVLVWLGPDRQFRSTVDGQLYPLSSSLDLIHDFSIGHIIPTPKAAVLSEGLMLLAHASWWTRLWVVQEVLLAQEAVLLVGSRETLWVDILRTSENFLRHSTHCCRPWSRATSPGHLRMHEEMDNNSTTFFPTVLGIGRLHSRFQNDMLGYLWSNVSRQTSDPRDRIYALLGLLRKSSPSCQIQPDYSLTFRDLSSRLVEDNITNTGTLDILLGSSLRPPRGSSWPSWTVSWDRCLLDEEDARILHQLSSGSYSAALNSVADVEFLDSRTCLAARGRIFDYIITVGTTGVAVYKGEARDWQMRVLEGWRTLSMTLEHDKSGRHIPRVEATAMRFG